MLNVQLNHQSGKCVLASQKEGKELMHKAYEADIRLPVSGLVRWLRTDATDIGSLQGSRESDR